MATSFDTIRTIKQTTLPNGRIVSTVWFSDRLGFDYKYETMVFPRAGRFDELICRHYSNLADALSDHTALCTLYTKDTSPCPQP